MQPRRAGKRVDSSTESQIRLHPDRTCFFWPAPLAKAWRELKRAAIAVLASAEASFIGQRSAILDHQSHANIPRFCLQALEIAVI
jgi:hypothetical protein